MPYNYKIQDNPPKMSYPSTLAFPMKMLSYADVLKRSAKKI